MTYPNPWLYNNTPFLEDDIGESVGFIYLITEIPTNRKYIGKKIFFNRVVKPPLKGKKKRRISKKFSDWETYYGSSEDLKQAVDHNGMNLYKREILYLCSSKSEMSYLETKEIFLRDALLTQEYFNSWVSSRINSNQLKSMIACHTKSLETKPAKKK